ncbi:MAG: tetratricopeptide repeat protein [Anaerolineae bacterium]|nr:tetratricopeptide repeat protein [Anaerolineae bacterium]
MRIKRNQSRLSFRHRRRRGGCMSLAVIIGLIAGMLLISWSWLERRITALSPPPDESDLINSALEAFDRGDLDDAIVMAREALVNNPSQINAVILLSRALIYRSYQDYDTESDRAAALELTTELIQRYPTNLDLRAAHAFALQANRQPAAAADAARRVLEENPDHGLARVSLALAYAVAGSNEFALRESLQAVRAHPTMMDAQRALAISYGDNGNYESAVHSVESAIALNGRLIPLYFERALYALQLGDVDSATYAYMQVLALDSENVKARLRLCELSSLLRERDAAIAYCTAVTERAPSWADGWYQLGREYFLQGNFEAAQTNLHQCSTLQVMQEIPVEERRLECWYLQGQAAEIRGDCPTLLATYNEFRAMTANSDIAQTWAYPPEGPPGCTNAAPATSNQSGGS